MIDLSMKSKVLYNMYDYIISVGDWKCLADFTTDKKENLSGKQTGVYQIIHKKDKDIITKSTLIHENMGYIGKSKDVNARIYTAKTTLGTHGIRRYLDQNNIDNADIFYRILHTEYDKIGFLESFLHSEMNKSFGYNFLWKAASEGAAGSVSKILELFNDLDMSDQRRLIDEMTSMHNARVLEEYWSKT